MKEYLPRSAKRYLLSSKRGIDLLAKASVPLSPWTPSGVFFFHQGRCGSTVVARLLNQHPKLSALGEIFEQPYQESQLPTKTENMLRARRAQAFPNRVIVEAKFFECQHLALLGQNISEFVDCIQRSGYKRFILLNRNNYLKKVVSGKIGRERGGKFHYKKNEEVPDARIHIDVRSVVLLGKTAPIVDLFEYMDEQYEKLRIALKGEDVLELTYEEDILDDPRVAYSKVCHWLGIENVPVKIDLRRTNVVEIDKVVRNWGEVSSALAGTRYAWMVK
jgi:hypothetical protein